MDTAQVSNCKKRHLQYMSRHTRCGGPRTKKEQQKKTYVKTVETKNTEQGERPCTEAMHSAEDGDNGGNGSLPRELLNTSRSFALVRQLGGLKLLGERPQYPASASPRRLNRHMRFVLHAHGAGVVAAAKLHAQDVTLLGLVRGIQHDAWHRPDFPVLWQRHLGPVRTRRDELVKHHGETPLQELVA